MGWLVPIGGRPRFDRPSNSHRLARPYQRF